MKHTIILPDLGQTTNEAKIVRWLKKPGDKVSMGEPLVEVETDKATLEVESFVGGYLRQKLVEEEEVATAMAPIAILTDHPDEPYDQALAGSSDKPAIPQSPKLETPTPKSAAETVTAVPAARSLAKELGIDLNSVVGTGPRGLITKAASRARFLRGVRFERARARTQGLMTHHSPTRPGRGFFHECLCGSKRFAFI